MPFVFYDQAVVADAGNGVVAGLFLPIANLPMVTAGEFASGVAQATKESKALLGIGTALYDHYTANTASILGFTASRTQTSVADRIVNWAYSFTSQKVAKQADSSFGVLPLPSIGTNNGIGGIEINDIFANAAIISAEGGISGEGVLIPNNMIIGNATPALNADKRDYFEGLLTAVSNGGVTLRTASVASGITAISNPSNYTGFALGATATDATNPTTGLVASDLGKIATVQKAVAYTVQLIMNATTGLFDVNSVVS
jgi:hypothetical protein